MLDLDTALRLVGMRLGDRALIGPETVQLDLTDDCTNNCLGCWARSPLLKDEDHYDTLEKGALDLAFVRRLLPQLRDLRVRELFLGGGGDPLCHPDVVAVIREAKQNDLTVTLNTNFTLADEALVEQLIDAGLDRLFVSVWAGAAATYARLHPNKTEAAFHHLSRLLRRLAERKKERGIATPRVKLYEVINSLNLEEIPLMVAHGREVGADEVEFAVFDPIPRRTEMFTLDAKQIVHAVELAQHLPNESSPPVVHRELFLRRLQNIDAPKGAFDNGIVASIPCAAGWFYSRVTTVGQVHACLKAHRVPVGDLRRGDFAAAWFGAALGQFRAHTVRIDPYDFWLRQIGHDIDFALPGCFRVCDNLGQNQAIMRRVGELSPAENALLDVMTEAAREDASLARLEAIYRRHEPVVLHGDNDLVHALGDDAAPWDETLRRMRASSPQDPIRVPVTIANVARLDRLFALLREMTGRDLDPALAKLEPLPLASLPARWAAQLDALGEHAARANVRLDRADDGWRGVAQRFADAASGGDQAELLRALGAVTGTVFLGPRTFHLDVTNHCEADCAYCWFHGPLAETRDDPYRLTDANRHEQMPWPMFAALADDLAALGAREDVVLSGKGDPLSHPRIADMIRALKERGLAVTLFTGGHRLDESAIQAILDAELDLLYVSLSAASEATFARLHERLAPGTFGRITAAVSRLVELRRAAGKDRPRIVLVDVLTNRNDGEIADFARLAARLGVDHLRYQLAAIEPYNTELAIPPERLARLGARLAEAKSIAAAAGIAVVANIYLQTASVGMTDANWTEDRYRRLGCLAGFVFGRAWADGTLSFCCAPRPIGNLRERSFAAWWRSDTYDRVRLAARQLGRHPGFPLADGGPLWTDVCRRCPNYEGIERLREVLHGLGLPDRA